jgi:putative glutamine amidotransferase
MPAPLIGITTYSAKNSNGYPIVAVMQAYVDAIVQAGGAPVLIPNSLSEEERASLFQSLDGILFTGGGDIAPETFHGEAYSHVDNVDKERDEMELFLVREAAKEERAFLGICRGFQVVNVALGGTLYTHIPDQIPNALKHDYSSSTERKLLAHTVEIKRDSNLAKILNETELSVNSLHHQGARELGAALLPVAAAPDGLVEGLELRAHPFGVAVQWHPEWLMDQPAMRRLFQAFVEAAAGKGSSK